MGRSNSNIFLDQEASKTGVVQRLLPLTMPGPITAHRVACQWNLPWIWKWAFPAPQDTVARKCLPNMAKYVAVKGPSWLEVGTCQLPLQRLHHCHCKLLTCPESSSGWRSEIRHSVKNPEELAFREADVFRWRFYEPKFLHFLIPREIQTSQINVCSWFSWLAPQQLFYFC